MARVTLDGVRKVYENGVVAIHGADFEVRSGEFMILVGPSGCGKSTLLRLIAGLESLTAGHLYLGDRLVDHIPPKERDIAMVFQNYALYPHMSVFDNMAFGLKLRRFSRAEIQERVRQAAAILGLTPVLDRKPKALSGGQRQRVAVGRAIVRNPQVFLFDEPLSNLDARLRVQMRTEIATLHRHLGATMIYVTHDQVEAMTMGDRIVVLKDGHIQQIDTPLGLYDHPANAFVAGFIGSPSMNFLSGRLIGEGGLRFQTLDAALTLPLSADHARLLAGHRDAAVTLGLRPENLYVAGGAPPPGPTADLALHLDVVEPMGHEIVLYAHAGSHRLVARVAPQPLPDPGQPLTLAADLTRLHFFDAETEEAIRVTAQTVP